LHKYSTSTIVAKSPTSVVSTKEANFSEGYQERQLANPSTIL